MDLFEKELQEQFKLMSERKLDADDKRQMIRNLRQTVHSTHLTHRRSFNWLTMVSAVVAAVIVVAGGFAVSGHLQRNSLFGANSGSNVPQKTALSPASVVVYYPPIQSTGPVPSGPTIDTTINVGSTKRPVPVLTASRLNVDVTLHANFQDVTFQPVTLHVDGTDANDKPYHKNYIITTSPVHLGKNQSKNYQTVIDVPPNSGGYTVMADSPTFNPTQRSELENILFVNHGGYYQTGVINCNIRQLHGIISLTVTQVQMTPTATHVLFTISGAPGAGHAPFAADQHTVLQQVIANHGSVRTVNSALVAWSGGPVHGQQDTTLKFDWEGDPTRSNAEAIHFSIQVPIIINGRLENYEHFDVVIPVPAKK